jgi:hypothetical protein
LAAEHLFALMSNWVRRNGKPLLLPVAANEAWSMDAP